LLGIFTIDMIMGNPYVTSILEKDRIIG
jgi:hypothetical protein